MSSCTPQVVRVVRIRSPFSSRFSALSSCIVLRNGDLLVLADDADFNFRRQALLRMSPKNQAGAAVTEERQYSRSFSQGFFSCVTVSPHCFRLVLEEGGAVYIFPPAQITIDASSVQSYCLACVPRDCVHLPFNPSSTGFLLPCRCCSLVPKVAT